MPAPAGPFKAPGLTARGRLLLDALDSVLTLHCIVASGDGIILGGNQTVIAHLRMEAACLIGRPIWDCLTEASAIVLRNRLSRLTDRNAQPFLLNFVPSNNEPFTLVCRLDPEEGCIILLGETAPDENAALRDQLLELNNQLAVLARENARKSVVLTQVNASLERTLQDLQESHWHLRKIAEVLPFCMLCGQVRSGENQWQNVVDYLKKNALFLSHCYCPECEEQVLTDLQIERREPEQ